MDSMNLDMSFDNMYSLTEGVLKPVNRLDEVHVNLAQLGSQKAARLVRGTRLAGGKKVETRREAKTQTSRKTRRNGRPWPAEYRISATSMAIKKSRKKCLQTWVRVGATSETNDTFRMKIILNQEKRV